MGVLDTLKSGYNAVKDVASDAADALGLDTKKAVLCVLNPNLKTDFSQVDIIRGENGKEERKYAISKLVEDANELQKTLLADAEQSLTSSVINTATGKGGTGQSGKSAKQVKKDMANEKYFLPFEVQYNPSSLRLETVGGIQEYRQNTQNGLKYADEIKQLKNDTNTYLSFQLVFDDTVIGDAFMLETGSLISNTAADKVKDLVNGTDKHSVQPQVDMLIAALAKAPTRQMIFFWSNMCFRGELTRANARYTMFNTQGNPIRATVDLTLEQNADISIFGYDSSYWSKAFDKVFEEKGDVGSSAKDFGAKLLKNNNFISF